MSEDEVHNLEREGKAAAEASQNLAKPDLPLQVQVDQAAQKYRRFRRIVWSLWLVVLVGALVGAVLSVMYEMESSGAFEIDAVVQALFGFVVFGGLGLFVVTFPTYSRLQSLRSRFEDLVAEQKAADLMPKSEDPLAGFFDQLVQMNLQNLIAYYGQVKAHAERSFVVSLATGTLGFILISAGLSFGFATDQNTQAVSYVATGSGVIVEFIAGVFFYLYNRTVLQMKEYHDTLLDVQNVLLSLKLVQDIEDNNERVKLMGMTIAYLVRHRSASSASTESEE